MTSVAIYIGIHLLNILAIMKSQSRIIVSTLFCLLSILALLIAPIGYDLVAYKFYLMTGARTELGYYYFSNFIYQLVKDVDLAIFIIRVIGVVFAIYVFKKISRTMRIYDVYLPLLSISTILFVQNNLRQGYSIIFLLLSIYYFTEKRHRQGAINFLLSILFHFSVLFVGALSLVYLKFIRKIIPRNVKCYTSYHCELALILVSSVIIALTITMVLPDKYSNYLNLSLEAGRIDTTLKSSILLILFYLKDLYRLKEKYQDYHCRNFITLRIGFIILALTGSILTPLDELFSRMTFIAFAFEFALLARLFSLKYKKLVFIEFLTPAAALNAINVLTN
jgi:hypothetical protein